MNVVTGIFYHISHLSFPLLGLSEKTYTGPLCSENWKFIQCERHDEGIIILSVSCWPSKLEFLMAQIKGTLQEKCLGKVKCTINTKETCATPCLDVCDHYTVNYLCVKSK